MIDCNFGKTYRRGLPIELTLHGVKKGYQTFEIPLDDLFYNDLNGRIATYIQEYKASNGGESLDNLRASDPDKYNDILADFIIKSADDNEASFNKTKEDIRKKGQERSGVVLTDGRIIDGNRRFTALRRLYKETGDSHFKFFRAVILPTPAADNKTEWMEIKKLELSLQFDVDEKRGYNRIDNLVSFYKDTMDKNNPNVLSREEYCHASGMKESEYNKTVAIVETMLDFLRWYGKPYAFHIVKKLKLDGPIEDIATKRKKMSDDEWNDNKFTIYSFMLISNEGDRTRDVRKLLGSALKNTPLFHELKATLLKPENRPKVLDAVKAVGDKPLNSAEYKNMSEAIEEAKNIVVQSYKDAAFLEEMKKTSDRPIESLEKARIIISDIQLEVISGYSEDDKNIVKAFAEDIRSHLDKIVNAAN